MCTKKIDAWRRKQERKGAILYQGEDGTLYFFILLHEHIVIPSQHRPDACRASKNR